MANRTATLYIRITTADGRKSYCKPVYLSKGRLKSQYAMVNGEPEHHPEGVYYLRFGVDGGKQQFVQIGKDSFVALDKLAEKQRWLRDRERQVVPQAPVNPRPETSRLSIDEAVEQYFKNLTLAGKRPENDPCLQGGGRRVPPVMPQEIHGRDWEAGLDRLHGMAPGAVSETAERRHAP